MHPILRAGAIALACASLAACASLQPPGGGISGALTAKDTFDRACRDAPTAYALFVAYDAVRPVSVDLRRTVRVANAQVSKVCAHPPADLAEAADIVTRAIAKVRRAVGRN